MREIVLASKSPRRRELLQMLGFDFSIAVSDIDETIEPMSPSETVRELSLQKAMAVWKYEIEKNGNTSNKFVIGADTIVACNGQILGKPKDAEDARRMLLMLQGGMHEVYSGVTLVWEEDGNVQKYSFFACTKVIFYPMTNEEIQAYITTGDCMDKAGAYGIQSKAAPFIKEIVGDYNNVVGLPVAMLYQTMKQLNLL